MSGALLDTSVVIASGANAEFIPSNAAISIVTVGELHAGVRLAYDEKIRHFRQGRLDDLRRLFLPLLVDVAVAERYGEILAFARRERRTEKATDLFILATAAAFQRTLHTFDRAQAGLAEAIGVPVSFRPA